MDDVTVASTCVLIHVRVRVCFRESIPRSMRCFELQLLPANNSHFYVTTNVVSAKDDLHLRNCTNLSSAYLQGCVLHGVRYGGKAPPAYHWASESKALERLTSVDFSPFSEHVFLVSPSANLLIVEVSVFSGFLQSGSENGSLRLHHVACDLPLVTWPNTTRGASIRCVRWSRSRPAVFFVLDDTSQLHIWDLTMSDGGALKSERIAEERWDSLRCKIRHDLLNFVDVLLQSDQLRNVQRLRRNWPWCAREKSANGSWWNTESCINVYTTSLVRAGCVSGERHVRSACGQS